MHNLAICKWFAGEGCLAVNSHRRADANLCQIDSLKQRKIFALAQIDLNVRLKA